MTLPYRRGEAKEWARERMRGCCDVLLPSFSSDLKRLNERAIRDEMRRFIEIAAEEKPRDFHLILHGSFDTVEDVIEMARFGAEHGCEALLLSYPLGFYPKTVDEIVQYTEAVSRGTDLGILLFAIGFWGFRRLHPSGFPPEALVRMADIDTVIALKYECGHPGTGGMSQIQKLLGKKI